MKTKHILTILTTSLLVLSAHAGPGHTHGPKREAGPNGGRVILNVDPHAEFFVTADRKVQITFLDDANQPLAPGEQVVKVTTGERSAPTKLTFVKQGGALLSEQTLPEGTSWPAVVQIKATPDAKAVVDKFTLNLAVCSGCKLAEYACICDHTH